MARVMAGAGHRAIEAEGLVAGRQGVFGGRFHGLSFRSSDGQMGGLGRE